MNLGKTRQINFYNIDETFYFVDLPGYGYSKMSKVEQEKVGKFIEEYLFSRNEICLLVLVLDIRHKPTENDLLMFNYIKNTSLPYIVIANKADKIAVTKVNDSVKELNSFLKIDSDNIIFPFSSERKIYTEKIWDILRGYLN